ncbi:TonB-dependent receptor [Arenibacter sp. F26102]|uniref:TonB-dependent receptor n=1 Tax=Arenibacter sp. F26102 TaxID=2926416 RepID=UPI001FF198AE|nr:TonB-dependent receptor [Arenibacter sp. F26102]MCK0148278.1 TonB-dependent receptor [Arenibacter sp. F26102]
MKKKIFQRIKTDLSYKVSLRIRLSALFMFSALLVMHANNSYSHSTRITLDLKNVTVTRLIDEIESKTNFQFVYKTNEVYLDRKVSVKGDKVTVASILNRVFQNTGTTFKVIHKEIFLRESIDLIVGKDQDQSGILNIMNQRFSVSGIVTDDQGVPLPGANIIEKGTTNGVTANFDGEFSLDVTAENTILVVSYIGYASKEVNVNGQTNIYISLTESAAALDEIIVVGYGSQKKSDLTGAISTVNVANLQDMPVSSIDQKLIGQAAGVQIQQLSGAPGGGTSVKIRGTGSIGAGNEPLYVIDGMPYSTEMDQKLNPLIFINPNDIESISILKDASSTAIYGSRGANGVIMITTKKGSYNNRTEMNVSSTTSIQSVPQKGRPQMMNQQQFADLQREVIGLRVRELQNREPTIDDYPKEYLPENLNGDGTDWYDLVLQTALTQDLNISINRGLENSRFSFNMGYYNQEGAVRYTGLKRYTGKLTLETNIGKSLKIGASLLPTVIQQQRTDTNSSRNDVLGIATWANPVMSPYDGEGELIPYIESPHNNLISAWSFGNPLHILRETIQDVDQFQNLGIAFVELEIIPDLKVKTSINTNYSSSKYFQYVPGTVGGANSRPSGDGRSISNRGNSFNWLSENILTYEKSIDKHRINALIGYTAQKSKADDITVNAGPYSSDLIQTINAAEEIRSWNEGFNEWSLISYLGRLNYSYDNKYFLTATYRSDGSSRFGEKRRFGSFPSTALSWRISEEQFLRESKVIDNLKLRASYGLSGNNNIGNYQHLASINSGFYVFDKTQVTASNVGLDNQFLTWEESKQYDVGLDLDLFGNRLSLVADYYNRTSSQMLLNDVLPAISGFTSQIVNKGNVRNTGFEFAIGGTPLEGWMNWDVNLNIAFNQNEVIKINDQGDRILSGANDGNPTHITEAGQPIAQFFGFVFDRLYTAEDLQNPDVPKYPTAEVGSPKYKDLDGDGIITNVLDYTSIGNPYPDFIFGFTNNFSFNNFDISITMDGQYGGEVVNGLRQTTNLTAGLFNITEEFDNRWRSAEDPGDGKISGIVIKGPTYVHRMTDLWVEDSSFLRISNLSLAYRLPTQIMKKNGLFRGCRLNLTAQNLAMFTNYTGANPQAQAVSRSTVLAPGYDMSSYPMVRTISFGVDLSF